MANKKPYIFFPIHNKYYKWYMHIVYLAKQRNWNKKEAPQYSETHHIIPLSLGGEDISDNLVVLTAREHFLLHKLLIKFTISTAKSKMVLALYCMANTKEYHIQSSKDYSKIRSLYNEHCKGENHYLYGIKQTPESVKYRISCIKMPQESINRRSKILSLRFSHSYRVINITDNIDYGIILNLKHWSNNNRPHVGFSPLERIINKGPKLYKKKIWIVQRVDMKYSEESTFNVWNVSM